MDDQDALESELRVDLMNSQLTRLQQEIKHETTRITIEIIVGAAALLGVGFAIGRFVLFHS